jgi:hypothetical protein
MRKSSAGARRGRLIVGRSKIGAGAGGRKRSGGGGIRTTPETHDKTALFAEGGAKSGALATQTDPIDPDLSRILAAWPLLPAPIRAAILALVGTAR